MKKIFIIAAALATLASCTKNASLEVAPVSEDNAIGFSAYTGIAATKGTVVNAADFYGAEKGIGVFAFYQPAVNGNAGPDYTNIKYPTPDFMYNQQIYTEDDGTTWKYSPIKYWPNNDNDKLSFFAYAPYVANTTWEDLAITTDATGKTINKTFIVNNDVAQQVDYLWAIPSLNQEKPKGFTAEGIASGVGTEGKNGTIAFDFAHVTSKVNIFVGVETDDNTKVESSGTPQAWTDPNTTIEIKSIEFKNLAQSFTWSKTGAAEPVYSTSGTQNIVAKPGNQYEQQAPGARAADTVTIYCDDATGKNPKTYNVNDLVEGKYKQISGANGLISNVWTAGWHNYLRKESSSGAGDAEYMFVAPQTFSDEEIVITYVVKTEGGTYNSSNITNVITKKWSDFRDAGLTGFTAGKQYNLYFLIGMQSVKIAATFGDWTDDSTAHVVDVPIAY